MVDNDGPDGYCSRHALEFHASRHQTILDMRWLTWRAMSARPDPRAEKLQPHLLGCHALSDCQHVREALPQVWDLQIFAGNVSG